MAVHNLTRSLLAAITPPGGLVLDPEIKGVAACAWWVAAYDPRTFGVVGVERPGRIRAKLREIVAAAEKQLTEERQLRIDPTHDDHGQRVFRSLGYERVSISGRFWPLLEGCTLWGGGPFDAIVGKGSRGEFVAAVMPIHPHAVRLERGTHG